MPGSIYWIKESEVLALEFYDRVTADDLANASQECLRMTPENRQLGYLIDLTDAQFPSNVMSFISFYDLINRPSVQQVAFVRPSAMARLVIEMIKPANGRVFQERAAAESYLIERSYIY